MGSKDYRNIPHLNNFMPLLMLFFLPGCSFPTLDHDHNMSKEVKLVFRISIKEQKHSCPVWMEHRKHGSMYWN